MQPILYAPEGEGLYSRHFLRPSVTPSNMSGASLLNHIAYWLSDFRLEGYIDISGMEWNRYIISSSNYKVIALCLCLLSSFSPAQKYLKTMKDSDI